MTRRKSGGGRFPARVFVSAVAMSGVFSFTLPVLADHHLRAEPEAGSGIAVTSVATDADVMVVAADERAVDAAREILRKGGSATDAAIAAQLVLSLVEPQSSGIGGGGFFVHRDGSTGEMTTLDGRETAPDAADPRLFLDDSGTPLGFFDAVAGGTSVGVPGLMHMLQSAHERFGRLPWDNLFQSALKLAEEGFAVGPRLHGLLSRARHLQRDESARSYFFQSSGEPRPVGTRLRNPRLFAVLQKLATQGANALYLGDLPQAILQKVRNDPNRPGILSASDLERYRSLPRHPVCGTYRHHRICGMGPPSSGGTTVLAILGMLERFDVGQMDPATALPWHLFAEAARLAYADRNRYVADPDAVAVPTDLLVNPAYLADRARNIDPKAAATGRVQPGRLPAGHARLCDDQHSERESTTHLSIVDSSGNAVALTSSIETAFGSGLMVEGFLLNNQLTDFAFQPEGPDGLVANRVGPGKRPRSSMAPTIVAREDGRLLAVVGSPGGSRIICYVAQALVLAIDWNLDAGAIAAFPHICNRNGTTEIESGTAFIELEKTLVALGHDVKASPMTSGLNIIVTGADGTLTGAADPRREGAAGGY